MVEISKEDFKEGMELLIQYYKTLLENKGLL